MTGAGSSRLPSGWSLWRQTFAAYRARFWRYTLLTGVVTVPTTLLNVLAEGDATVAAYGVLAALFMNAALIYAIIHSDRPETARPKLRQLYYEASAPLLRYIIVGVVLAIMLIPAALGLSLVGLGGTAVTIPSVGELVLLGIIGLIMASPSIYLLVRHGLATIAVIEDDLWPGAALAASRRLTKDRFWAVLLRYLAMIVGLLAIAIPITFVCVGLFITTQSSWFLTLYQVINTVIILPLFYFYLYRLYRALEPRS